MSSGDTRQLIEKTVDRFLAEVPALKQLKLVVKLELFARGDVPVWRVEVPGPKVAKDPAGDARLQVSIARPQFNELAEEGTLRQWARAFERGHVKVTGDAAVLKLIGNVVERQLARTR